MTIVSAGTLGLEQIAAVFNAGYEGYFVPMHVDAAALGPMLALWDVDLARSRVALRDGEPIGLVNLGVRGDDGWIGGLAVVPAERRRGVGRALMEAVLAGAPTRVTLEVLEQNEPAIRLYEQLGFTRTRVLEIWSLAAELPSRRGSEHRGAPARSGGLPWQRADASLPDGCERIEVDGAAALIRVNGAACRRCATGGARRGRSRNAAHRGPGTRRGAPLHERSGGRPGVGSAAPPGRKPRPAPVRVRAQEVAPFRDMAAV